MMHTAKHGNCNVRVWHAAQLDVAMLCSCSALAWAVKATENSRMPADTIDKLSCVQKLNQPMRLQAFAALDNWVLAYSDLTGTSGGGPGAARASIFLTYEHKFSVKMDPCRHLLSKH
jgi:hypothetical protein